MKLLLDSHIWYWTFNSPEKLGRRVLKELHNPANQIWLSPLSIWELLLAAEKGRIEFDRPADQWLKQTLEIHPVTEAPLTSEVALEAGNVQLDHRDPIDRLLAATARAFDLTLITADKPLLNGKGFAVLANR